jgi:FMN phosphatase YigB (HAD superfamily)/glycosyltransferase involved in cell wall biosynthesis
VGREEGELMRVAIVHYHLQPGGVTRVIESSSQALEAAGIAHAILPGGEIGLPALGYLSTPGAHTAAALLNQLRHAAREALGGSPDLWHFHNHSLGKNCLLPAVVAELAEAGERLVLQIHDLAEDGRPENFALIAECQTLYPTGPHVCYAFINSRDQEIFIRAGLPPSQAVLLPNPVNLTEQAAPPKSERLLFAPIRGIRRKNLGELVLLSALAPEGSRVAVSRVPLNPRALPIHEFWQNTAKALVLPIEFNVTDRLPPAVGAAADFESWIAHASHFVSSSVAEGFGLPFLEAAAHGKPILGRKIPPLGAELSGQLYDRILLPKEWISPALLRRHLEAALARTYRDYRRDFSEKLVNQTQRLHFDGSHLDFANLPEVMQRGVVEKLSDPLSRRRLLVEIDGRQEIAVDWLATALAEKRPPLSPALLAPYSLSTYQASLCDLYGHLLASTRGPVHYLAPSSVLDALLQPETFHFLQATAPSIALCSSRFRAVCFDCYGTLLVAPKTGVQVDPPADAGLRAIIESHGFTAPASPSAALHAAMLRQHAASSAHYPEVDLRELWREILQLAPTTELGPLVESTEANWHPCHLMPGAEAWVEYLAESGIALGLLSNAQCNTLPSLGKIADHFAPDLSVLSYQEGIAKPAPELFQKLATRLAHRGIAPQETLFVGNDPRHDIIPARAAGFQTALFTGHPLSLRPGDCQADYDFQDFLDLIS